MGWLHARLENPFHLFHSHPLFILSLYTRPQLNGEIHFQNHKDCVRLYSNDILSMSTGKRECSS